MVTGSRAGCGLIAHGRVDYSRATEEVDTFTPWCVSHTFDGRCSPRLVRSLSASGLVQRPAGRCSLTRNVLLPASPIGSVRPRAPRVARRPEPPAFPVQAPPCAPSLPLVQADLGREHARATHAPDARVRDARLRVVPLPRGWRVHARAISRDLCTFKRTNYCESCSIWSKYCTNYCESDQILSGPRPNTPSIWSSIRNYPLLDQILA